MQILESRGLEVYLVNAKHVKNVPADARMFPTVSGFNTCMRLACYGHLFAPPRTSAQFGRCCATAPASSTWRRATFSTCGRHSIR
jgi:hypothetical protein